MRSTGRNAAPVTIHTTTPSASTSSGAPRSERDHHAPVREPLGLERRADDHDDVLALERLRSGHRAGRCDARPGTLAVDAQLVLDRALRARRGVSRLSSASMFADDESTRPSAVDDLRERLSPG